MINLIRSIVKHSINIPHAIGIQEPGVSVLAKPMEMDMTERKIRYKVKRERRNKRNKGASFFIMQSYFQSVCKGILPPF